MQKNRLMYLKKTSWAIGPWVVLISLGMLATTATAQGQSDSTDRDNPLRWKFSTGDQFNVSLIKTGNVETQVDTRVRKVEIKSQLEFRWDVIETESTESTDPTDTTIQQTLTRVVLESGAPGDVSDQRLSYDSSDVVYRKGVSNTVAKQLKPLIGLTYQFVISDRGEIKSVSIAARQQQLLETIPASLPIKDLLTSQGQQSNLGAATWVCPEVLTADRTWKTERTLDSKLGTFNRSSRFVAGPPAGGIVEIDVVTDVKHDANMALKMFEGKGRIDFDVDQGFVPRSQSTTRMITESPYRDLIVKTTIEMMTELKLEKVN